MNAREERGLVIAALCKLKKDREGWLVPSQTSAALAYTVDVDHQTCTCPDHQEAGHKCKHIFAVEITIKREFNPDGTVTDTESVTLTQKKTYRQEWPKYNLAQTTEKKRFQVLLHDLCRNLPDPPRPEKCPGPKPHRVRDAIFSMTFKVYCQLSSRRFACDLDEAHEKGYVTRKIPGMKVPWFFEQADYTSILKGLIAHSATPLRSVETKFAIDSSGFGSNKYERWFDQKYGITRLRCKWVKAHIACGVQTNIVTAVRIFDQHSGDCPQFIPLLKETRKSFEIGEVSADKAYASLENFEAIADCGASGFLAFKEGTTGFVGGAFKKAFHYFQLHQEEYMEKYHRRSNVESTISAIKRKFGASVMSRNETAMVNETLCKILAHNLTCLIMEQEVLGIAPEFWPEDDSAKVLEAEAVAE